MRFCEVIDMGRHRSRLKILEDVLSVIGDNSGIKKTKIMYRAYLSYKLLNRYLNDVLDAGLVTCDDGNCYWLTNKGEKFLARFDEYSRFRKEVEQKLNHIEDQREALKKMCPSNCVDFATQKK
jgi:predicted transcriptional regulator